MSTLTKQDTFSSLLESAPKNFETARLLARESYLAEGIPAVKAEEYKFTNIGKKLEQNITNFSTAQPFKVSEELVKSSIFEGLKVMFWFFPTENSCQTFPPKLKGQKFP